MCLSRRLLRTAAVLILCSCTMVVAVAAFSMRGTLSRSARSSFDGVVSRRVASPSTESLSGVSVKRFLPCRAPFGPRPPCFPSWRSSSWSCRRGRPFSALPFDEDGPVDVPGTSSSSSGAGIYERPDEFDLKTTVVLVGGQALLILAAVVAATILGTPQFGLGSGFDLTPEAAKIGLFATAPLFVLALVLDFVEKSVPALKDVTMATQRSVLALLGGKLRPVTAVGTAIALGAAAGVGEEMLFRGVLQTELSSRFGDLVGLVSSSIIFGALHAVTPLYAFLASVASVYFGYLYMNADNLAVPIVCHGLYDVGALLWAHWTICAMTAEERTEIREWVSPVEKRAER